MTIKTWIENNFTILLFISFACGLFLPGLDTLPYLDLLVSIPVGVVIFFCCANIRLEDMKTISLQKTLLFYVFRFILLPLGIYFLMKPFVSPSLSISFLLFFLSPAGIAAPVIIKNSNGNVAISLGLAVVSSLMAPIVLPGVFSLIHHGAIAVDAFSMLRTLSLLILLPLAIYFGIVRKISRLKTITQHYGQSGATVFFTASLTFAIASQRAIFFSDLLFLGEVVAFGSIAYFFCYALGLVLFRRSPLRDRIAYAASSGINNTNLGIVLAFLYFDPRVALFMVLTKIPVVISIPLFLQWVKKITLHSAPSPDTPR